jgi:hypothetical protein
MDQGEERIEDQALLTQLQRQARSISVRTTLFAAALTAIIVVLP